MRVKRLHLFIPAIFAIILVMGFPIAVFAQSPEDTSGGVFLTLNEDGSDGGDLSGGGVPGENGDAGQTGQDDGSTNTDGGSINADDATGTDGGGSAGTDDGSTLTDENDSEIGDLDGGLSGEVSEKGIWYYYDSETHQKVDGWVTVSDGIVKYYDGAKGRVYGEKTINSKKYLFDKTDGHRIDGWYTFSASRIVYFDGANGMAISREMTIDGKIYYFGSAGNRTDGLLTLEKSINHYNEKTGLVEKVTIEKVTYYQDKENGRIFTQELKVGSKYYFFDEDGAAYTGWKVLPPVSGTGPDRNVYYDGANGRVTGEKEIGDRRFLFDKNDGSRLDGWQKIGKRNVYLEGEFGMVMGEQRTIDDKIFFFSEKDGNRVDGLATVDGKVYYHDGVNGRIYDVEKSVGGKVFYFGTNDEAGGYGLRFDGWKTYDPTTEGGKPRIVYFDGANGRAVGEKKIIVEGVTKYFYFNKTNGGRVDGFVVLPDGRRCYYNGEDGRLHGGPFRNLPGMDKDVDYTFSTADGRQIIPHYGPVWKGIDVSQHQGNINWSQVKASGIQFAIIRAGYIASDESPLFHIDTQFLKNVKEAWANGLAIGLYFYVYGYTDAMISTALNQFHTSAAMNEIRALGIHFDLPVFLDIEDTKWFYNNTGKESGKATRTNLIRNGMNVLKNLGYTPGFYSNYDWAVNKYDAQALMNEGYKFWLARYYSNDTNPPSSNVLNTWSKYPYAWQYRSTGSVPGINGNVDMNYLYF